MTGVGPHGDIRGFAPKRSFVATARSAEMGRKRNGSFGASGSGKRPFTPPDPFGRYWPKADFVRWEPMQLDYARPVVPYMS